MRCCCANGYNRGGGIQAGGPGRWPASPGKWIGERGRGSLLEQFAQAHDGRAFRDAGGMKGWPGRMALGLGFSLKLSPKVCFNVKGRIQDGVSGCSTTHPSAVSPDSGSQGS